MWLWSVGHHHTPDCRTFLILRRAEHPHAQLRLVFRDAPGRIVPTSPSGSGELARPSRAPPQPERAGRGTLFLDEAAARGLLPTAHGIQDEEGWALYHSTPGRSTRER